MAGLRAEVRRARPPASRLQLEDRRSAWSRARHGRSLRRVRHVRRGYRSPRRPVVHARSDVVPRGGQLAPLAELEPLAGRQPASWVRARMPRFIETWNTPALRLNASRIPKTMAIRRG